MNVGQILETHLGWAAKELGRSLSRLFHPEVRSEALRRWFREVFTDTAIWRSINSLEDDELLELAKNFREGISMATPVFDGARESEIRHLLEVAGLPESGKISLYDGMTGDLFAQDVTVGYIYMLKLSHLVDDKIHARSIGPYSLITQQPLGGKAQFGGQRFGEMEVWRSKPMAPRTSCRNCSRPSPTMFMAAPRSTKPSSRENRASSPACPNRSTSWFASCSRCAWTSS
jgi:DNA-directed RNA polymerase subunit beta